MTTTNGRPVPEDVRRMNLRIDAVPLDRDDVEMAEAAVDGVIAKRQYASLRDARGDLYEAALRLVRTCYLQQAEFDALLVQAIDAKTPAEQAAFNVAAMVLKTQFLAKNAVRQAGAMESSHVEG